MEHLAQLGTVTGLVTATTLATHFIKRILTKVPVPIIALFVGELMTVAAWQTGYYHIQGLAPETAGFWEWVMLLMWALTTVVSAMGVSTVIAEPRVIHTRGGS